MTPFLCSAHLVSVGDGPFLYSVLHLVFVGDDPIPM